MTEKELRAKLVSTAQGYLGCKESNGSHKKIIDLYNSNRPSGYYKMTYTDAWCACFGSAMAMAAGLTDIIPVEVSCNRQIERFKALGCWQENDAYVPAPGDYIFYDWQDTGAGDNTGSADHVGIVVECDGKTIKVIEGNMSNAVGYRTLAVNGRYIRGFGLPNYGKKATTGASTMKLVQSILTKNPCYTAGRKITVKGLMLHSVGCAQPSAQVFVKNWNSPSHSSACVHGFIDANDGTVYQTLPWNHRGWHCASGSKGSGNNTHIGVEMCEPGCIKYTGGASFTCSDKAAAVAAVSRTYQAAVQLFAMLCKQYGLDPLADGVIISHKEGCARGIASNHGDPEHLWTQLGTGYTMNGFRQAVKAAMGGTAFVGGLTTDVNTTTPPASTTTVTVSPYVVRIKATDLNIRTGPGTDNPSKGYIKPGAYTIIAEATGKGASRWGKLKSGAGWVSLDFCTKI